MSDPQAPGEQVEGELDRREIHVALGVFEPLQAHLRRALQALDRWAPLGLVRIERGGHVTPGRARERARQGDGVLHGELRARSHGEVGGVRRVAQQHDLLVMPPLAPQRAEGAPQRAVLEEPMALQLLFEQRFAERERRVLVGAVHPRRLPGRFRGFDDERRAPPFVLVGVDPPQAVAIALEVERERGEGAVRAEPHVAVGAPIHGRVEPVGELLAHHAVEAVGRDDEIGPQEGADVRDLPADLEAHAERFGAAPEDREQRAPRQPAKPVTGGRDDRVVDVDGDIVPMVEVPRHLLVGLVIRVREGVLRGVGEDDAEAEGRLQRVSLEHRDVVRGIRPLHLDGEVEPGRPAAHRDDPHAAPPSPARFKRCPATMSCWISVVPS